MMKYPIGVQSFEKIREDGFAYVDKTDLMWTRQTLYTGLRMKAISIF